MFKSENRINVIMAASLTVLLSACGGSSDSDGGSLTGGGSTGSPTPTPAPASPTPTATPDPSAPNPVPTPSATPAPSATPTPTATPAPQGSFNIVSSSPDSNAVNRSLVSTVTLTFNKALVPSTVDEQAVYVLDENDQRTAMSINYSDGETSLDINFDTRLKPSETYTIVVSSRLMAADGDTFTEQRRSFETVANIGGTTQAVIDQCMSEANINMLAAVNEARAQSRNCGTDNMPAVPALAWHCLLKDAAQAHSQDMVDNGFFSHTSSDGSQLRDRITRTGYLWNSIGENIARGQRSIPEVMEDWIDSPGHCRNIMGNSFTEFGSSEINFTWTQNFGRSRN